jgi:hypothetical protein
LENKMSKNKTTTVQSTEDLVTSAQEVLTNKKPSRIDEIDRMAMEIAKTTKKAAESEAGKALAQNETATLNYRYVILQIYMKYGLSSNDALGEDGNIIYNGNVSTTNDGRK